MNVIFFYNVYYCSRRVALYGCGTRTIDREDKKRLNLLGGGATEVCWRDRITNEERLPESRRMKHNVWKSSFIIRKKARLTGRI